MIVAGLIRAAQTKVIINCVIIWNPNTSRALYVGQVSEIPDKLKYKEVKSYRYSKEKERMIIRI
jgi:hypothetical protein